MRAAAVALARGRRRVRACATENKEVRKLERWVVRSQEAGQPGKPGTRAQKLGTSRSEFRLQVGLHKQIGKLQTRKTVL